MKKRTADLKINGRGSAGGGKYNSVLINGSGTIDGDLECIRLNINGYGDVKGNVKANSVDIHGNSPIKGSLRAKKAKIHGTADINGNLSVDEAETYGSISVNGDCNAEIFKIEGTFAIKGLLNAGELKLSLYGSSEACEIGGAEITVKKGGKLSFLGLKDIFTSGGHDRELTVDIIEGDDVYLENTQAKVVRGNTIILGSGCKIELVEYRNNFKNDEGAEVGTHKKI